MKLWIPTQVHARMQISYPMVSFQGYEMLACLKRSQLLCQPTFHNVQTDLQRAVVLRMLVRSS